ncbi:glycosyltransferase [Pullulanibacillus sp. KACC 23026]|uniref:glycosyltransferase n=1 Tax=Pullulanibacillus sp. KACC 23026 TaxID=3028315 RepID=UPI0023B15868|nr:glycosyltransferase [Pullulanibacillus sp. KACC 23026]WEG11516.1 glycosyltransferase [Pullulanibacillus sp. KACC 23026]
MKKKLLFVALYLQTGGVEKSLISLLSNLDYAKYEVDLLLFDHSGMLFKHVPREVNILPPLFETFSTPITLALPQLIRKKKFLLVAGKVLAPSVALFSKGVGTGARWAVYKRILPSVNKEYDVAVSYLDFFTNYYVAQKVKAKKKIVYNHMDYASKVGWQQPTLERKTFEQSNYIVTVAESSKQSLVTAFPEIKHKIRVIHNSVSPRMIKELSEAFEPYGSFHGFTIVTVARLVKEKGVLLALETCKKIVKAGKPIRWYLIGGGDLYEELKKRIQQEELEEVFIMLGEKDNPYPYMAHCDVYVQPSFTEAHCVAVEEALVLAKPVVVTNIPPFQEQINDRVTGILSEPNVEALASTLQALIKDRSLRERLTIQLQDNQRNQEEVHKFIQLLET